MDATRRRGWARGGRHALAADGLGLSDAGSARHVAVVGHVGAEGVGRQRATSGQTDGKRRYVATDELAVGTRWEGQLSQYRGSGAGAPLGCHVAPGELVVGEAGRASRGSRRSEGPLAPGSACVAAPFRGLTGLEMTTPQLTPRSV